jgi:hypothetical protein
MKLEHILILRNDAWWIIPSIIVHFPFSHQRTICSQQQ